MKTLIPTNCITCFQFEHTVHGPVTPISNVTKKLITIILGNGEKELVRRNTISVSEMKLPYSMN